VPALAPVSPKTFKAMLQRYGFEVAAEDDFNWCLFKREAPRPVIIVPKEGDLLSLDIMMSIVDQLKMDNKTFFDLLQRVSH